jgi:hypothetical protein
MTDQPSGHDGMTEKELDQLLAAVNRDLLGYVQDHADPNHMLTAIMAGNARNSSNQAPPASEIAQAITLRSSVEALAYDLTRVRVRAFFLDGVFARDRADGLVLNHVDALADDLASARDRADGLADDLASARDLTDGLANDLTRDLTDALADDLTLADELSRSLAHADALTRGDARGLSRALVRTLDRAVERTRGLARELITLQLDASGADLTEVNIADPAVLDGVIWDEETRWPPGVRAMVEPPVSKEIRPGVYLVRTGDAPDRSQVPTA